MTTQKTSWSSIEMQQEFTVIGFSFGYCSVIRKSDGKKGSLDFGSRPRIYHSFILDDEL